MRIVQNLFAQALTLFFVVPGWGDANLWVNRSPDRDQSINLYRLLGVGDFAPCKNVQKGFLTTLSELRLAQLEPAIDPSRFNAIGNQIQQVVHAHHILIALHGCEENLRLRNDPENRQYAFTTAAGYDRFFYWHNEDHYAQVELRQIKSIFRRTVKSSGQSLDLISSFVETMGEYQMNSQRSEFAKAAFLKTFFHQIFIDQELKIADLKLAEPIDRAPVDRVAYLVTYLHKTFIDEIDKFIEMMAMILQSRHFGKETKHILIDEIHRSFELAPEIGPMLEALSRVETEEGLFTNLIRGLWQSWQLKYKSEGALQGSGQNNVEMQEHMARGHIISFQEAQSRGLAEASGRLCTRLFPQLIQRAQKRPRPAELYYFLGPGKISRLR